MAQPETRPDIQIPGVDGEKLPLGRVGIVAFAGFMLGIVWPRLAGIELVPSAPVSEPEQPAPAVSPSEPQAPPPTPAGDPAEVPAPKEPEERILIGKMQVTSCQDAEGRNVKSCDEPDWSRLSTPRLLALRDCDGAEGLSRGTLSLGVDLDFKKNKVGSTKRGRSTTIARSRAEKLLGCAENEFATVSLEGIEHKHPKYTVYYALDFLPAADEEAAAGAEEPEEAVAASGRATVGWEVALIREAPERDSKIVARILGGTRVAVTRRQGDWYRVKYDAKGREGWVFRTAIGL